MPELADVLDSLIPFRFLSSEQLETLCVQVAESVFAAGETILDQGDLDERSVYVLLEGRVQVVDDRSGESVGTIEEGRYFGERSVLFDLPRTYTIRALEECRCATIEAERFLELLDTSPAFAQSLGDILRDRQGLFREFDAFMAELMHGVARESVSFRELRARYHTLAPALHSRLADEAIDFEALTYALHRLPEDITRSYMLYLTDNLHELFERPSGSFRPLETDARRRTIFEMMPGKLMILLRDGISDLVDFLTCLCAYAVEARKIRRRVARPRALARLADAVSGESYDDEALLDDLGFGEEEREHLRRLWPEGACRRIYELALHHEDFGIQVTKQLETYNSQHAEVWTAQIAEGVVELFDCEPRDLDASIDVHIVSSNTHSVLNCLSPFIHAHTDEILSWGRTRHPGLYERDWPAATDQLYAVARHWLEAHPDRREARLESERDAGMLRLRDTAMTGIVVELIDTARLDVASLDPALDLDALGPRSLVVNIDYAFGQQAEEIMASLLTLFGRRVASVNVLGKAGALQGARGDILVASSFLEQSHDLLTTIALDNTCDASRIAARLPQREVQTGTVLTVGGTLLQNRVLLHFYRHIWKCIGLEMEGTYYLREVDKARKLGVIPEDVDLRFIYYVSDVPLQPGETLAGALRPAEGIPPLYAITREILGDVL